MRAIIPWTAAVPALLLLLAPLGARAAEDEAAGRIGGAFGEEPAPAWVDPFPAEAFRDALPGPCPALLDHRIADLRGRAINLCAFSGKVLLLVNTASR